MPIFLSRLFSWMRVRVSHADTPAAEAMANVEIAVTAYQGTCFMNSITSFTGSSSLAEVEINLRRGPQPRQDDDIDPGAGAGRGRGSDCADVKEAQLAAILSLDLDAQGLTKLAAGVFEGLRSLTNLHLPRNGHNGVGARDLRWPDFPQAALRSRLSLALLAKSPDLIPKAVLYRLGKLDALHRPVS